MLGAIIGDIVGSRFEWNNNKSKEFEFFAKNCFVTDDSVMTLAIGHALLASDGQYDKLGEKAVKAMREIGQNYPLCGYGGRFRTWLYSPDPRPYHSHGNGAAMRVSPCGLVAKTLEEAQLLSRLVTEVTHNHPEGLKGAEATATCVFLAKIGWDKLAIYDYVRKNYYPLDFDLDSIRGSYKFNETCEQTVPQALEAFFESQSFEDAIRGAISIGGDSDTLGAITGSVAGAYYGIPKDFAQTALTYLDDQLTKLLHAFLVVHNAKIINPDG
ncbi:MAG: ADP-ribosylglycohydrolase family protein [Deltaproteobacteria bacterium]|jgi:type I restriction enzyme M protein|nr:ADP-ribosylglycohydrolase family protein [Deltaproteobacteria bacterium]